MDKNKGIKIIIVDDHHLIIEGLISRLEKVTDIEIVAIVENGKEALEVLKSVMPDVILMDVEMPVMNGLDATQKLKQLYPSIKIIALSTYDEKSIVQKMIDLGVHGYVLKNISKEDLITAIKAVHNDEFYFSNEILITRAKLTPEEIFSKPQQKMNSPLSEREAEVLQLVAQGLTNIQISKKLFISDKTVNTHRTNLMKKLEVHNVAELIRAAIHFKLI